MLPDLATFTFVHVILSVLGIVAGLVVVGGFLAGVRLDRWIAVFLVTTLLTSLTGFGFPFKEVLPAHLFGVATLLALPSPSSASTSASWRAAGARCSWACRCSRCT